MADEKTPSSALEKLQWAEAFGKLVLLLAGLGYAAGLLITNISLQRYRIASFSLNRPEYILVGTIWIAFMTFLLGWVLLSPRALKSDLQKLEEPLKSRIWRIHIGIRVVLLVLSASGASAFLCAISAEPFWSTFGVLLPTSVVLGFLVRHFLYGGHAQWPGRAVTVTVFLLGTLYFYANYVYPKITAALGGGRYPIAVVVLESDSGKMDLQELVAPVLVKGSSTARVEIILVDSDYVTIAPVGLQTTAAVQISKAYVKAVRYE